MKKSDIQKSILDYLRLKRRLVFKHRNVGIMKSNGSYIPLPVEERGISDIIGCLPSGRFFAIEVKRKGNKPSAEHLIRSSGILAPSFHATFSGISHCDIRDARSIPPKAYIATAFSPHGSRTPLRKQDPPPPGFSKTRNCLIFAFVVASPRSSTSSLITTNLAPVTWKRARQTYEIWAQTYPRDYKRKVHGELLKLTVKIERLRFS